MQVILKRYSVTMLMVLFLAGAAMANDGDFKVEKKKTYTKSYNVSSSERVSFDNQFGELKITTWDKNEVKVDVTMVGKANTDEIAQEVLDRITIEDGKGGSGVFFKTKIGDGKDWPKGNKYNNTGFSIDFVVYMPAKNPLNVENEFGKTFIPDYSGEITVHQKFGALTAGKLSNTKKVHIEFGGGSTIESINGGELSIHFSRTLVNKVDGKVKVFVEHCGAVKLGVDNSLTELTINNNFTTLHLDVSKSISATFKVHTNFSELDNDSGFSIKEEGDGDERRGPKFDHDYNGKAGNGTVPIKIRSEFGNINIGHNISFDPSEKEEKNKNKSKSSRNI